MTRKKKTIRSAVELAKTELAAIRRDLLLQQLLDTEEPNEEVRAVISQLRNIAQTLTAHRLRSG